MTVEDAAAALTGAIPILGARPVPPELESGALPQPARSVGWFVPGRIEVFGKHTDYAGGRSLLASATRGITFTANTTDKPTVTVTSRAVNDTVELPLSDHIEGYSGGHWAGYAAATVSRLVSNFGDQVRGAEILMESDLPLASGMSSSSAMVVGLARCLMDLSGIENDPRFRENVGTPEEMAAYLACIENGMSFGTLAGHRGVGTFGGSEDHTAMLCGRPGALVQYSFCPTKFEREVPFPKGHRFVILVTGVLAEKTGAALEAYNRVSASARELLSRWNQHTGRNDLYLDDALSSQEDAADIIRSLVPEGDYLRARLEQYLVESNDLVPAAGDALEAGDLAEFARATALSQKWTDQALGNQVPETRAAAKLATDLGAVAASAFGAGFGGSVWALVKTEDAADFADHWLDAYVHQFPTMRGRGSIVHTRPGDSARRISLEL